MKRGDAILTGLLGLSLAVPAALGIAPGAEGNPYEAIPGRNVFALKPPTPPPDPNPPPPRVEPPKIRLQGIHTILGRKQVMFKAQFPAKPPQPAKEESLLLSEGHGEGEIQVLAIDEKAGTVKFSNHGQIQNLNMVDDADKPATAAAPAAPPAPGRPGVPPPAMPGAAPAAAAGVPAPIIPTAIPPRTVRTPTTGAGLTTPAGTMAGGVPVGSIGGIPTGLPQPPQTQPALPPLSHEEQELIIEVNRLRYQQEGDSRARILPPTSLSPPKEPVPTPQP